MIRILLILLSLFLALPAHAQSATARANTADPTWTNGNPAPLSVDLSGYQRTLAKQSGTWTVTNTPATSGGLTVASAIVPNNTTAVVIKGSAGQVFGIKCFNNSATIAYIKIYNATSATAGSGTPQDRLACVSSASSNGAGFVAFNPLGDIYSTGITYIVTTGISDADTTAPAASTYLVSVHYK